MRGEPSTWTVPVCESLSEGGCCVASGVVGVTACPRVLMGAIEQAPTDFGVYGPSPRSCIATARVALPSDAQQRRAPLFPSVDPGFGMAR